MACMHLIRVYTIFLKYSNILNMSTNSRKDYFQLSWGLTTHQPLWVILCHLPEKGRKEKEEVVEEMRERDRKKEEQE